jgi:hypothetical protein
VRIPKWLLLAFAFGIPGTASAVTIPYTSSAAFLAALPGTPITEEFDGLSHGEPVGALGAITYTENAPDGDLVATNAFATTSPTISLGISNLDGAFQQGDDLFLSMESPVFALGLFVITSDPALAGEVELVTPGGTAPNSATEELLLADGGLAYYVGIVSDTPFATATLSTDDASGVFFLYNVDDVTLAVPEPGTGALVILGLCGLAGCTRSHRSARRKSR